MEVDRLAELRRKAGKPIPEDVEMGEFKEDKSSEHMKLYDLVREGLSKIQQNVRQIDELKDREKTSVNDSDRKGAFFYFLFFVPSFFYIYYLFCFFVYSFILDNILFS